MKLRINNSEYERELRKWKQWVPFKYVGGEIRGDTYCKERWPPRSGAHACLQYFVDPPGTIFLYRDCHLRLYFR